MANKPPEIKMCDCSSSQIAQHGYDPATKTLAIRFHGKEAPKGGRLPGATYHYSGVSQDDYDAFTKAKSFGVHFGANIRSKFKFTRQP